MTIGEKICKLRKEYNYTQEQLADRLGVSRQSISKWESDLAYPETDKLIELGKLFNCSMDYLLKDGITEKTEVTNTDFTDSLKKFREKVLTEENKRKAKKALKIAGIAASVILAVDLISMIVYFIVFGIPT